jgi:hypothetical protein
MKRSLVLVLIGVVALAVGCAKQEPAPPAPPADASDAAAAAQAGAPAAAATPGTDAAPAPAAATAPARPAPPARAPESVKDFPDYPGAVRVAFSERTQAGKDFPHSVEAEWTSADAYVKVVEYYQKAVVEKGWTIAETKTKKSGIEWQLTMGTSVCTIEVKDAAPVTVKVERKDR